MNDHHLYHVSPDLIPRFVPNLLSSWSVPELNPTFFDPPPSAPLLMGLATGFFYLALDPLGLSYLLASLGVGPALKVLGPPRVASLV